FAQRANFGASGLRFGHVSSHSVHGRRHSGHSASRDHSRRATSKYERTRGRIAKHPPRGDGSAGGERPPRGDGGHHHRPQGPILTAGNSPITPVMTGAPPSGGSGTANVVTSGGSNSAGNGGSTNGGGSGGSGRDGFFPPSASDGHYVPNEVLLDIRT